MVHKRTIIIPLDEFNNPLGANVIEATEEAAKESVHDISEDVEKQSPEESREALAEVLPTPIAEPVTSETETVIEPVDDSKPTDDMSMPASAEENTPEPIQPAEPPPKVVRVIRRHSWGR